MLISKIQKWVSNSIFLAVEHTGQSQKTQLSYLIIENKKDALKIISFGFAQSIQELKEQIPNEIGLSIIINNDKVLTRVISSHIKEDEALLSTFPTLKLSDFYYEIVQNKDISYISVCRKSDVEVILDEYKKNKLPVISFSLGNSSIFELENYIKDINIQSSNAIISFNSNNINNIIIKTQIEKENYLINDLKLTNEQILSFSSILSILEDTTTHNNFGDLINIYKTKYKQRQVFQKGVYFALGLLFLLLLVNMLFFSFYQTKIEQWKQNNGLNLKTKQKLLSIEKDVTSQKKLINEIFQSTEIHTTYIFDDLTAILPESLSLKSIWYQPITKRIKPNKVIEIDKNLIMVEGSTTSDTEFTSWIKLLEQKQWVKSVVIVEYGKQKNTTNFKTKIQIKNEWEIKK